MAVSRPIFIIGVGRSGSSVFHRIFASHPQVVWLSPLSDAYPERPGANRMLMSSLGLPLVGSALSSRFEPGECYTFWDHFYPGFSVPCRDLRADDVFPRVRDRVRAVLDRLRVGARQRHLLKITGWPRVGFLNAIFPDALFIHVLRDGRPVASSFLNVDWWWGWRGPSNWRWGELSPAYQAEWEHYDRSFVALAGIQWKILMNAMEEAKTNVGSDRFMEIRYEDLCDRPLEVFRTAVGFAQLEWSGHFERQVKATPLRSENDKWRRDFNVEQQAVLESVIRSHLDSYGYP